MCRTVNAGVLLGFLAASGCRIKPEWSHFRYSAVRQGDQYFEKDLFKPAKVSTLHPGWPSPFHPSGAGFFTSSPVVYKNRIYIGNSNGRFYAINASTGAQVWQFPAPAAPPLDSQFHCNPSSNGIASSAAIASINGTEAVIFGAPDQSSGNHLGDGHLFALNARTGALIWESPAIARITGTGSGNVNELHEQIGYSAPLVWFGTVYVGVADHCDNPIQNGKIMAVDLTTGNLKGGFSFSSTNSRGGGVWSSPAAFGGLLVTTGNTRFGASPEPSPNHGLSMLRLDFNTGAVVWKHQPVPFSMDNDPDWLRRRLPGTVVARLSSQLKKMVGRGLWMKPALRVLPVFDGLFPLAHGAQAAFTREMGPCTAIPITNDPEQLGATCMSQQWAATIR
jgi:glucose dehydrogenase